MFKRKKEVVSNLTGLTNSQMRKVNIRKEKGDNYVELYNYYKALNADTRMGRVLTIDGKVVNEGVK